MKNIFAKTCCLVTGLLASVNAMAFCGFYAGKADASLFNETSQVIVVRDGKRTITSMMNDYQGPLNEFALIVPTPEAIKEGQVKIADIASFKRLDEYSSPRLAEYHDQNPCRFQFDWGDLQPYKNSMVMRSVDLGGAIPPKPMVMENRSQALGVTVDASYTLEEYDIVSLSAKQSDGLEIWLRENGYHIPEGASKALKPYINQGMKFFVAKVNLKNQAQTGYSTLRPLQFAVETNKFMLPMRLGMLNAEPKKPQDLIVYLMTKKGRVESSNYQTIKLPSNVNLPFFVKPKFPEFYKDMFAQQATKYQNRAVFTEYFWDMSWCDPCAAKTLSNQELLDAGVYWAGDGDPEQNFQRMMASPSKTSAITPPNNNNNNYNGNNSSGAQPVSLTRLHVRYTPDTFPEDLMFTETADRDNWQARYVIQQPFPSDVASCSADMAELNCQKICASKVKDIQSYIKDAKPIPFQSVADHFDQRYRYKSNKILSQECVKACKTSKDSAVKLAVDYYQQELPDRIQKEKETLAQLSGWSMSKINAIDHANLYSSPELVVGSTTPINTLAAQKEIGANAESSDDATGNYSFAHLFQQLKADWVGALDRVVDLLSHAFVTPQPRPVSASADLQVSSPEPNMMDHN